MYSMNNSLSKEDNSWELIKLIEDPSGVNKSPLKRREFWELINSLKIPLVLGKKNLVFVKSSVDDTKVSIPGVERPWLSKAKVDESSVYSTPIPQMKKLDGAEPIYGPKSIKSILRSKSTFKAEPLKDFIINKPSSAPAKGNKSSSALKVNSAPTSKLKSVKIEDDLPLAIYERIDHRTCDHAEYISTKNISHHLKSLGNASGTWTVDAQGILLVSRKVMAQSTVMISSVQESLYLCKAFENLNWLWHKRLANLNFKTINKLAKQNLLIGLPSLVYSKDKPCSSCKKGKHHRSNFKTKETSSIKKCLHLLHMDLFRPVTPRSINHEKYTLVIVDEYSRNNILVNFCDEKGISQNFSSPYTPEQNGVAERKNITLIEAARTMLSGSVFSK
ncbi:retrovirus-related pol polyprotein from transposon TNT 1-94 [Tanacetum coccineum]